jgi:hypothetical protein
MSQVAPTKATKSKNAPEPNQQPAKKGKKALAKATTSLPTPNGEKK